MKRKWNRVLAALLCALMLFSDVAGAIPAALDDATPLDDPAPINTGAQFDFRDEVNGRPNLFVSFLGDNNHYVHTTDSAPGGRNGRGERLDPLLSTTSLYTISAPAPYDQGADTNPTGPGNRWEQYTFGGTDSDCDDQYLDRTVFWVGLGVDRLELLELLKDGDGLTSLEAGFYYDSNIIEPYLDPT